DLARFALVDHWRFRLGQLVTVLLVFLQEDGDGSRREGLATLEGEPVRGCRLVWPVLTSRETRLARPRRPGVVVARIQGDEPVCLTLKLTRLGVTDRALVANLEGRVRKKVVLTVRVNRKGRLDATRRNERLELVRNDDPRLLCVRPPSQVDLDLSTVG